VAVASAAAGVEEALPIVVLALSLCCCCVDEEDSEVTPDTAGVEVELMKGVGFSM
jgi:hypothetical protein